MEQDRRNRLLRYRDGLIKSSGESLVRASCLTQALQGMQTLILSLLRCCKESWPVRLTATQEPRDAGPAGEAGPTSRNQEARAAAARCQTLGCMHRLSELSRLASLSTSVPASMMVPSISLFYEFRRLFEWDSSLPAARAMDEHPLQLDVRPIAAPQLDLDEVCYPTLSANARAAMTAPSMPIRSAMDAARSATAVSPAILSADVSLSVVNSLIGIDVPMPSS
jgi:hypothetical protein